MRPDDRLGGLEDVAPIGRQRDGVGARILPRPPALEEALADHGLHDLRDRGAVDAGAGR